MVLRLVFFDSAWGHSEAETASSCAWTILSRAWTKKNWRSGAVDQEEKGTVWHDIQGAKRQRLLKFQHISDTFEYFQMFQHLVLSFCSTWFTAALLSSARWGPHDTGIGRWRDSRVVVNCSLKAKSWHSKSADQEIARRIYNHIDSNYICRSYRCNSKEKT